MPSLTLLGGLVALASLGAVHAQDAPAPQATFPATPLAQKRFTWGQLPYKVDTDTNLIRGVQKGYNICNSTTEGQDSLCQTSVFSAIDDFCLWAPPEPGHQVGDIEGEMVAWCTKPGRGTRLIPDGALTGLQFVKTPDYISLVGFIDQTKINMDKDDWGGEMDPHGADLRGNPMGGLVFSEAFGGGFKQVIEWHNFMGGNAFCLKACDPASPNAANYCEHKLDRIGCAYNVPNAAQNNVFESCLGENQDFPGIYVDGTGATQTYQQPEGQITSMPYTARVPATSSCTPFESTALFTGLPKVTGAAAPSVTGSVSGSAGASGSLTRSVVPSGSRGVSGSGSGSAANPQQSEDAGALRGVSVSVVGVVVAAVAVLVL